MTANSEPSSPLGLAIRPRSPNEETEEDGKDQKKDNSNTLPEGAVLDHCFEALITQWGTCIEELRQLQAAASPSAPIHGLGSLLKVQQRALDKALQKRDLGLLSPANYFGTKSCCWDDKWAIVKKYRGLVSINKDFPRSPRVAVPSGAGWLAYKDRPFQEKPVAVDAVVDNGATWLKFVSITPRTLQYQVIAEGWESEDDDEEPGDGLGHTEFADSIRKIVLAARWNHCHHIHLLLSGLREGESEVVDKMLAYLRTKIGGDDVSITISCANSSLFTTEPPPSQTALNALLGSRDLLVGEDCRRLTQTVNLDPSALAALVTDLHHGPVALQPKSQQDIIAKSIVDHETANNELVSRQDILATVLFPALRGRKLVCTRFAASYFRQLIGAISTHSEEVRASLILPPSSSPPPSRESLLASLQEWTNVPLPADLLLPIEIVDDITLADVDSLIAAQRLPPMAAGVAADLSRLNQSIYLYGWANRVTTVMGHRGIERQIQLSLASHWTPASAGGCDERPPDIWHRHLGGYLVHRDKPKDWREMIPAEAGDEVEVPAEVIKWTYPWMTWGRGISTYGVPDTKTWDGVGHEDMLGYGRRTDRRERDAKGEEDVEDMGEQS
ncbi:hypothetical protein B0H67DRAFT_602543 [Lasiosphaeris hirsuta]|uniref:DUF1308 domain-containing protein n=1 Tax=Lasiosphaeris hirsuta TaxID=260670 RepID=A0AA40A9U9_9PEZI|nr:hypothetical protein B0H67DRAFT_602543 [Lasiosphaeris hirsuta]